MLVLYVQQIHTHQVNLSQTQTIILIKNENYYEPIGLYHIDQKKEIFSFNI